MRNLVNNIKNGTFQMMLGSENMIVEGLSGKVQISLMWSGVMVLLFEGSH